MFLHLSVSHSVHQLGGGLPSIHHWSHDQGVCIQGDLRLGGWGCQTPPPFQILQDMVNFTIIFPKVGNGRGVTNASLDKITLTLILV